MTDIFNRCNEKKIDEGREEYDEPDCLLICIDLEGHEGDHIWRSASVVGPHNPWEYEEGDLARPEIQWEHDMRTLRHANRVMTTELSLDKEGWKRAAEFFASSVNALIGRKLRAEHAMHEDPPKMFDTRTPTCEAGDHGECDIFNCGCECHGEEA